MYISGKTTDALINEVLKHEVMHTVSSAHLNGPFARWLDEGIASIVEGKNGREDLRNLMDQSLKGQARFMPFSQLMPLKDYPKTS